MELKIQKMQFLWQTQTSKLKLKCKFQKKLGSTQKNYNFDFDCNWDVKKCNWQTQNSKVLKFKFIRTRTYKIQNKSLRQRKIIILFSIGIETSKNAIFVTNTKLKIKAKIQIPKKTRFDTKKILLFWFRLKLRC